MNRQQQQPQAEQQTTEQDLLRGPVGSRAQTITEGTAAFLGVPPEKVFEVLRGVWTTTKGQPPLTREEMLVGMALVARYELDPFAREIYVTRGKKGLMTIIGLDGWIKVLSRTDHYDGFDVVMEFDGERLFSVTTTIYSTKRSHPAAYTAFASEYAKLGGFMGEKIPSHMLRVFSLKHAARLFVPLGAVVTQEEADWMTAAGTQSHVEQLKEARASAIRCEQPPLPPIPPPPPAPAPDPPTAEEVEKHADPMADYQPREVYPLPDQIACAEGCSQRIADAVSVANVDQLESDTVKLMEAGRLTQTHAAELAELIAAARVRVQI